MHREIPGDIAERLNLWHRRAVLWHVTGFLVAFLGTVSGLAVTAFTTQMGDVGVRTAGFVTAVCTAILALGNPIAYGNRYRRAWRILDNARLHFSLDDAATISGLISATQKGEEIIGLVEIERQNQTQSA